MVQMSHDGDGQGAVPRVVARIHEMLTSMELLPGQPVRQEALAARLGVSRAPVREALGILRSEGVLDYERNLGYTVKRLTTSELEQTYLMRRGLETELIRALPRLQKAQLDELDALNARMQSAGDDGEILAMRQLNNQFHFSIFEAAGYDLVVSELRRIWTLTDAYRSFYLYEPAARERVVREHAAIVSALREHDLEEAIKLVDHHRRQVPAQLAAMMAGTGLART